MSPLQQCLALFSPFVDVTTTMFFHLTGVTSKSFPPFDLAKIVIAASPHPEPAIPLKKSSRILVGDEPPFAPPRGGQSRLQPEGVELLVRDVRENGVLKPLGRILVATAVEILPFEDALGEHLMGSVVRLEVRVI